VPIKIDPDAYYPPSEAGEILDKQPHTLAKLRCHGTGAPYIKQGRQVLYRGSDLIAFLEDRRVQHGAAYRARFGGEASNG